MKSNSWKTLICYTKKKFIVFWRNSIKESNQFYPKNRDRKKMTKLDFLRKLKIKLRSLALNSKKSQRKKWKDILTCKIQENLTKSSLQILSWTAFSKTGKPFQEPSHRSKKCSAKRKAERKLKSMGSFAIKTRKHTKKRMMKDSTIEIERISRTLMKK